VAVVLLLVIVRWWGSDTSPDSPPGAGQAPGITSGAGKGDGGQHVPIASPAGVTWQVFHAAALPFSADAGPRQVADQAVSGFAHTPVGALLAVAQASYRVIVATDPGWRDVVETMIAPGPGRDAFIQQRSTITMTTVPPNSLAQLAGFQFLSYTDTDAVIQMASRNLDGSYGVVAEHVVWVDGDWKLMLADNGGGALTKMTVPSLAGFVAWGAV
jgi:hypothetical protein